MSLGMYWKNSDASSLSSSSWSYSSSSAKAGLSTSSSSSISSSRASGDFWGVRTLLGLELKAALGDFAAGAGVLLMGGAVSVELNGPDENKSSSSISSKSAALALASNTSLSSSSSKEVDMN